MSEGAAAGRSLAELALALRSCVACDELAAARQHVVVGDTPPGASVLLLGEGPGAAEDAVGRPFVGRSGQLLDTLLLEAGMPRETVAVLNVVRCRPPGNRVPTRVEAGNCRGWLDRQLALIAPSVIVTLGTTATTALLGKQRSLAAARAASPHELFGARVLATYHPSAALRWGPKGEPRALLLADLIRARELDSAG